MRAWPIVGLLLVAELGILPVVPSEGAGPVAGTTSLVEAEYTGDWVCQTFRPGYNIRPPSADASQPLTNHMITPSTVVVLKLTLRTDGTYMAAGGGGRFALDPTAKTITWLDGPYRDALRKTQLGRRDNGAPTLGFIKDKRYYGCLKPEQQERGRQRRELVLEAEGDDVNVAVARPKGRQLTRIGLRPQTKICSRPATIDP